MDVMILRSLQRLLGIGVIILISRFESTYYDKVIANSQNTRNRKEKSVGGKAVKEHDKTSW